MLVLTILQGPDKGRRFELPANEPQMIGRSSESLPLTDQTISRRHAELTPDDGRWYIRDLNSSNGTFVNGVRVHDRRLLRPGDQVRTGMTLFLYGQEARTGMDSLSSVRLASKDEVGVNVEHTVASNDDSMIMAVPEPSQAATLQLKVIYELTALIGSVTDQQTLLERVMDLIFEYFQADRGFILIGDEPGDEPRAVVARHRVNPDTDGKPQPIEVSRTIVQYVLRKQVGVLSSNAMNDARFATGDSVQNFRIRSAMCVPIRFKDRIHGVIHLDSQIANYTYTEDQLTLLTAIGVQTGLALTNNRSYEARLKSERLAAVGQTVASLSHSIKNILQGLRGGADVVELGLRKGNVKLLRNGWEIVSRNLDRIYELTMNMLAFSKQRNPELELTNVGRVLEEVAQLVQQQFEARTVALITDVAPDLPPVPLDASGIHQAVLNLLNNALDAVEPDSGVVSLRAEYDADKEQVRILVSDNGQGMTQRTMNQLFEPFHSTKGMRGTGLGLVVTKKIVDEHRGRIQVESTRGEGTTFTIELPIAPADATAAAETHGPQGLSTRDGGAGI